MVNNSIFFACCAALLVLFAWAATVPEVDNMGRTTDVDRGMYGTLLNQVNNTMNSIAGIGESEPYDIGMGIEIPGLIMQLVNIPISLVNVSLSLLCFLLAVATMALMFPAWAMLPIILMQLYMLYGLIELLKGFL